MPGVYASITTADPATLGGKTTRTDKKWGSAWLIQSLNALDVFASKPDET
jgi:hypothetical protein